MVINLFNNNRKEAKGRPNIIGMPFVQPCPEAEVQHSSGDTLFLCRWLGEGTGHGKNRHMLREGTFFVSHTWEHVIGQSKCGHCKCGQI